MSRTGRKGMKFLDPNDRFFAHPLVRWTTVLVPLAWGVVEFVWQGSPFWGILFLAASAYAAWQLFFVRKGD
jgi:hypothetical protein